MSEQIICGKWTWQEDGKYWQMEVKGEVGAGIFELSNGKWTGLVIYDDGQSEIGMYDTVNEAMTTAFTTYIEHQEKVYNE